MDRVHDKNEGSADQNVKRAPVPHERGVAGEVDAGGQLVAECEHHRQIGVEMDEVPGFVGELASCDGDRQRRDSDEESERDDRRQQALVARDEVSQLAGNVLAVSKLVTKRLKHGVTDEQANREIAIPLVEHCHALQAEGVLQERQPSHEQELPQDEVGAEQTCHPADAVEKVRCIAGDLEARAQPPETQDDHDVDGKNGVGKVWPRPR